MYINDIISLYTELYSVLVLYHTCLDDQLSSQSFHRNPYWDQGCHNHHSLFPNIVWRGRTGQISLSGTSIT